MSEKNCVCGYAIGHPLVSKCTCKEWQGLSDEEIEEVYKKVSEPLGEKTIYEIHTYAKAIEQKLKEKNK